MRVNDPTTEPTLADVQLLAVGDVARLLAVHPRTVWRLSATGEIPAPIRLGGKSIRWRLASIKAYLDALARGDGGGQ